MERLQCSTRRVCTAQKTGNLKSDGSWKSSESHLFKHAVEFDSRQRTIRAQSKRRRGGGKSEEKVRVVGGMGGGERVDDGRREA